LAYGQARLVQTKLLAAGGGMAMSNLPSVEPGPSSLELSPQHWPGGLMVIPQTDE
jgi:hypothetical protein